MYLKKTPNTHGRIRLSIVDNYYDRVKKCSRQKTIESIGFLDELQKIYEDPIAHFQKRVDQLKEQNKLLSTSLSMILTACASVTAYEKTLVTLLLVRFIMNLKLISSSFTVNAIPRKNTMPTRS